MYVICMDVIQNEHSDTIRTCYFLTCPPKKPGHGKPHKYGQKWPGHFATNHQKSSWSVWCWISGCVIAFIGDIWIKKTWRVIISQALKHHKIPELTPGPEAFYIFQHLDLRCQRAQQAFLSVDRMWPTHLREMTSPRASEMLGILWLSEPHPNKKYFQKSCLSNKWHLIHRVQMSQNMGGNPRVSWLIKLIIMSPLNLAIVP